MKVFETETKIYALAIGKLDGVFIESERYVKNHGKEELNTVVTIGKIHFPKSLMFSNLNTTYYIFLFFRLIVCKKADK